MNRRFLAPSLLALSALALAGCKSAPADTGGTSTTGSSYAAPAGAPKYKLITNGISPFWDSLKVGMNQEASTLRVGADYQGPQPSGNTEQIKIFHDAIAGGVNGIGISAIDPSGVTPIIDQTVASGVPVVCFDSDAPNSKRLAYLGTNNYEAGQLAGQAAVKLFPNGGKLIAFVGTMSQQNAIDRYQGFVDAVKGHNITFLTPPYEDNQDKGKAITNVQDAITRYQNKGLNGLVGLYSYNGPAIISALQQQNLRSKFKVVCFDGDPATLTGLTSGMVDLTVVQNPLEEGALSIELLNLLHQDHNDIDKALQEIKPDTDKLNMKIDMQKHIIDTGVTVITPANAAAFIKGLAAKGITST